MSIISNHSLASAYFSAQLPDLEFSVSGNRAQVRIDIDGTTIYNEALFPLDGVVAVTDIGRMVEPYAERLLVMTMGISVTELSESGSFMSSQSYSTKVLFSRAYLNVSAEAFYSDYFLSKLLGEKITALNRLEYLHYYGNEAAQVTAYYDDTSFRSFDAVAVAGNGKYTTIDVSPSRFVIAGKLLCRYVVKAGSREQTFVIDHKNPDCAPTLLFTNSFGVQELLYCTGTHKVAPKYTRSNAIFSGKFRNYDIEETRIFKADTGILNTAMADWADDLFRSKEVYVVNFTDGQPVVGLEVAITESNSENNNNDDTLPRFSFEYRYCQRNHNVMDVRRPGRIFDNTFDNTFN